MSQAMHRLPTNGARQVQPRSFAPTLRRHFPSLPATQLVLRTALAVGDYSERANDAFTSATQLYDDGHWEFAFERIALLADHGHTPAAKLALLMLRYGSALYGTNFVAHPAQVARWAQRVLRATSRATTSPSSMTASA